MAKQQQLRKVESNVPAFLTTEKMSGVGVPTDQKDFLIPMARVLDPKSPECEKRGANYIQGAEPGDIYIKNAPVQIIKGETGFLFQPCYREEAVIEWIPRTKGGGGGGGYVDRHPADFIKSGSDAIQRPHPDDPKKMIWYRKSTNNLLVETRYYGGYAVSEEGSAPMPLVLTFASTGHTVAKQWNMLLALKSVNGVKADIWACYYRIKTRLRQRGDQAWYTFEINDAGDEDPVTHLPRTYWVPSKADFDRGKTLHDSIASGAKVFEDRGTPDDKM